MSLRTARITFFVTLLILLIPCNIASATSTEPAFPQGWWQPSIGAGRGYWDLKVGVHAWTDHVELRNLRLRGLVDLGPGIRASGVFRSNRDVSGVANIHPTVDELYVERLGFYTSGSHSLALSARLGKMRYLRFPYPDAIAVFDQVPGIEDLRGKHPTGYSGLMLTGEYKHASGAGLHFSGLEWEFGSHQGRDIIEAYGFLHQNVGKLDLELRAGILAVRPEPLGKGAPGFNLFIGYRDPEWHAGLLYEQVRGQPIRTGVMVRFVLPSFNEKPIKPAVDHIGEPGYVHARAPVQAFSRWAGEVALDYTRAPQGIAVEVPLGKGYFGGVSAVPPNGAVLVGEIFAERVTTYWQNGQSRNLYEHVLGKWGKTGDGLSLVVVEAPWHLHLESLVSPHILSVRNLKQWERARQGPAQLGQRVVYQFYE